VYGAEEHEGWAGLHPNENGLKLARTVPVTPSIDAYRPSVRQRREGRQRPKPFPSARGYSTCLSVLLKRVALGRAPYVHP
jgi:hypothetical protein